MPDPLEYQPNTLAQDKKLKSTLANSWDALRVWAWRKMLPDQFGGGELTPAQHRHTKEPIFISDYLNPDFAGMTIPWLHPNASARVAGYPGLFQDYPDKGGSVFMNKNWNQPEYVEHELAHVIHQRNRDNPKLKEIIRNSGDAQNLTNPKTRDGYMWARLKEKIGDTFPMDTEKFAYAFNDLHKKKNPANRDMIYKIWEELYKTNPQDANTLRRLVNRRYEEPRK